jgi:predicted transport protein
MPLFKEVKGKLKKLKSISIAKEKHLQKLVEENLFDALDMHFLATEYQTTSGGRIDTLAVDSNGAPVIIEYKRNSNHNVINQGLSYLRWLQAQKVDFFEMIIVKKLDDKVATSIKIDWKNPRVVCIAENYNKYDIDTVEVIPIRIELFKYRYYDDGIFSLEPMSVSEQQARSSSSTIVTEKAVIDVSVDTLLERASESTKNIFSDLRERILELDENIKEKATSLYIAYRVAKNFAEIHVLKDGLKIHLRPVDYDDPKGIVDKIPEGYNWTMDRRIYLKSPKDLDYVFGIIEQSYKDVL